jgi:hypothetical protein
MKNSILIAAAIISFVFCITNYYYGYNGDTCITSPNIAINSHNDECNYYYGCIDYKVYFYVESSLLALFVTLFVLQFMTCGICCAGFSMFVLLSSILWSIVSAYLYFNRPIDECSQDTKIYIVISTIGTLLLNSLVLIIRYCCNINNNNYDANL